MSGKQFSLKPNNPIGMVLSKDEVELVVKLVAENDAYIVSDEVYEKHINFGLY